MSKFWRAALSLTHLAALQGDVALAASLQRLGVFDHSVLNGGIKPAHLAALRGQLEFLQHARAWGCSLEELTTGGYTPIDIFETVHPDKAKTCPASSLPKTIKVMNADKTIVDMPLAEVEDRYHFIFTDRACMNAATMELTLSSETAKPPLRRSLSHTSLAIVRIKDLMPELEIDPGLGIIATEGVPKGTNLGLYSGLYYLFNETSVHQLETHGRIATEEGVLVDKRLSIDGEYFHNLISLIADGFPNVAIQWACQREKGAWRSDSDYASCLIALRDIRPGELILWNYGFGHPITFDPYIHLAEDELHQFLRDLPAIAAAIRAHPIRGPEITSEDPIEEIFLPLAHIDYFFARPRIFFKYILLGHADLALFDPEFLKRIHFTSNIHALVQKLRSLFESANTPEKRKIVWEHLEKRGKEDFARSFIFFEDWDSKVSPAAKEMTADQFRTYLDTL